MIAMRSSNLRSAGSPDVPEAHSPPPPAGPVHLHVTISRGTDLEQVIQRLGKVYDLLQSFPGEDHFSLYVDNGGQGQVQIDFPNDTTRHCLELEQALRALVGAAAVHIAPMHQVGGEKAS